MQETRLSQFAQFQFVQLQQLTELFTSVRYPLDEDASYISDLLEYVSGHSNDRVRNAYHTFVRSLGVHDIEILQVDFFCLLDNNKRG